MGLIERFKKKKKLLIVVIAILLLVGFLEVKTLGSRRESTFQTARVEKGTLVVSLSQSGQVAVANKMSVTTQASGIISEIDLKNGDTVSQGQKIAEITLDILGQQRNTSAWSSYLSAKNTLDSAQATLYSLQSDMFSKWKTYKNLAESSTYQNSDGTPNQANRILPEFYIAQDDWLATEAKYKNQQGVIAQAQAVLTNSWLAYQNASPIITAPMAGIIGDLTLVPGMQIEGQTIASVTTQGKEVVSVNLSEVDATQVKAGNKAMVTLDALPGKTFTGSLVGINTTGIVSSGVTTYPATIILDNPNERILSNMSATANIITTTKEDVLLVPTAALQTQNGRGIVRVLRNGKISQVAVKTGESSETQTEIISGLTEGEQIIIGSLTSTQQQSGSSPFGISPFGGRGGVGGGGLRPR